MDDTHSPPKLREAFDAAQHLQTSVRLLRVFNGVLAQGPAPYPYQRWEIVDQVIAAMQRLLDQGVTLVQFQTLAAHMTWPEMTVTTAPAWMPPEWPAQLKAFFEQSRLTAFWNAEQSVWLAARAESERV